jgi:UDP-GlcNAc:undecaprenyl-phosphate GlcNAc-1-phosphate transferase
LNFLFFGFSAFLLTLVTTPLVLTWAKRNGFLDDPKTHRHPAILHTKPIPRAGGLAIWLAVLPLILLGVTFDKKILGIILGGSLAVLVGTLDDKYEVSPYIRLFSNFAVAAIVVAAGIGIGAITNPFGGMIKLDTLRLSFNFLGQHSILVWADLFGLFWIVFIMNMLNWSSGVDGQLAGIVVIVALTLLAVSLKFLPTDPSQKTTATICAIVVGASLGFLIFNWHPAKIFPGYGATVLGFLIAVLAILSSGKVATALLVLAVPIVDGIVTIGRRVWQKKIPVWGDRAHFHHLLLDRGLSQRQIALFYWTICAILGAISLYLHSLGKLFALLLLAFLVGGTILWLYLSYQKVKTK